MLNELSVCTQVMTAAAKPNSKHGILSKLVELIRQYNERLPGVVAQKTEQPGYLLDENMVGLLDLMNMTAMGYLLRAQREKRKDTGRQKWDSVKNLLGQIEKHEECFQIRSLRPNFDNPDETKPHYWLERLERRDFEEGNARTEEIKKAFGWLPLGSVSAAGDAKATSEQLSLWMWRDLKQEFKAVSPDDEGILYLQDVARRTVNVTRENGALVRRGQDCPFDTMDGHRGSFSGLFDSYIYVCSAKNHEVYSWYSKDNLFHHSSFICGEPVIAAGDWIVKNGKVLYVNAESGHYKPTEKNMHTFAILYAEWWTDDTLVQPQHKGPVLRMKDFIERQMEAAPVDNDTVNKIMGIYKELNDKGYKP